MSLASGHLLADPSELTFVGGAPRSRGLGEVCGGFVKETGSFWGVGLMKLGRVSLREVEKICGDEGGGVLRLISPTLHQSNTILNFSN